jgi:hypothetical protein
MSHSAQTSPGLVRRLAHWWQRWKITPAVEHYGVAEAQHIAHGLGASAPELHTVAGKWPDAVEPLNRQLVALDAADIHRS